MKKTAKAKKKKKKIVISEELRIGRRKKLTILSR